MGTEKRGRRGGVKLSRLQEIRLERGYTVRGLAAAAGVNPATVTAIEHGHRGAQGSTLRALAKTLLVETSALVGASDRGEAGGRESRRPESADLTLALAARAEADREGRDPREVYARMRDEALTVEAILGGAAPDDAASWSTDDPFDRARKAAASHVGLAEVDRSGESLAEGEGASDEISAQRAGRLTV